LYPISKSSMSALFLTIKNADKAYFGQREPIDDLWRLLHEKIVHLVDFAFVQHLQEGQAHLLWQPMNVLDQEVHVDVRLRCSNEVRLHVTSAC
jgi:hypothetical protein